VDSPPPLRLPIQFQSQLQFTTVGNGSRDLAEIAGAHVGNGAREPLPLELKLIGEPEPGMLVGTTPGANEARSKPPRSINGRSLMNLRLTTWPVTASSVCSCTVEAFPSMVSVVAPTVREISMETFWLTSTRISRFCYVWKPLAITDSA